MPDEIRIPINAKIPISLHDSILTAVETGKFKDKTTCITEALEKLFNNTQIETKINLEILHDKEIEIQNLESALLDKYTEITRLHNVIQEAPDPIELAQMRTRSEELEKHNATLKNDLENLQNLYNNYMLQMQTLINQKAIEAPGVKKPWWRFW